MHAVRIVALLVALAAVALFSYGNWRPVSVLIWDGIVLETKIPALMLLSFLLGFVPMWLLHHGRRWRFQRRIRSLENAAQSASVALAAPPAVVHETSPETSDNKPEPL